MSRRLGFLIAGMLGAVMVAGGTVAVLHPVRSSPRIERGQLALKDSFIEDTLADFAPGAVLRRDDDGALVIVNARFSEVEQAKQDRANAALKAGPSSITCAPGGDALRCAPIADDHVVAALRGGTTVYGRSAITGVTREGGQVPKVEADALTCGSPASDGTVQCWPVTQVAPPLLPTSDVVVYYDHFDVTFEGSRMIGMPGPGLTVPVAVG